MKENASHLAERHFAQMTFDRLQRNLHQSGIALRPSGGERAVPLAFHLCCF